MGKSKATGAIEEIEEAEGTTEAEEEGVGPALIPVAGGAKGGAEGDVIGDREAAQVGAPGQAAVEVEGLDQDTGKEGVGADQDEEIIGAAPGLALQLGCHTPTRERPTGGGTLAAQREQEGYPSG